jgi:hypothetical protein
MKKVIQQSNKNPEAPELLKEPNAQETAAPVAWEEFLEDDADQPQNPLRR